MFHLRDISDKKTSAFTVLTVLATAFMLSGTAAQAQKKAGKAAAKTQKPWVKICRGKGDKKACTIRIDEVDRISLKPYSPIMLEEYKGKSILKVTLPHTWPIGVTLTNKKTKKEMKSIQPLDVVWDLKKNAFIQLGGKDAKKIVLKFNQCNTFGCIADIEATKALIGSMKKAKSIIVAGYSQRLSKPHGLTFPLGDFAASYDGDSLDEKVYANALGKKVGALRKKRYDFMKKRQKAMVAAQKKAKKAGGKKK